MAFVASALASLAPLWQAVRTPPNAVLTEGVRASAGGPVRRISQALVVAEIALAFTLLTVSVILVVHLRNLGRVPTGFDPSNLLTFQLSAPGRVVGTRFARTVSETVARRAGSRSRCDERSGGQSVAARRLLHGGQLCTSKDGHREMRGAGSAFSSSLLASCRRWAFRCVPAGFSRRQTRPKTFCLPSSTRRPSIVTGRIGIRLARRDG